MKPCNLLIVLLAIVVTYTSSASADSPRQAIILNDEVRIRDQPSSKGKYVSILYKNMIVTALENSDQTMDLGGESHYWYKIKNDDVTGWIYGKFLSFDIPVGSIDTYDTEGDMAWFYDRFSYSTNYYESQITVDSLDVEQYRILIKALEQGEQGAYYAAFALKFSLLKHLATHPDDPKYQYLKKKISSKKFITVLVKQMDSLSTDELPYPSKITDKQFLLQLLTINGYALSAASDTLANDREVVLAAVKNRSHAIKYASNKLKGDRDLILTAVKSNGSAVIYASDKLKDDKEFALAAMAKWVNGYQYLSNRLKADKEVTQFAVSGQPHLLRFAIDPSREIVLTAVKNARYVQMVMPYIPYRYTADKEILKAGFDKGADAKLYTQFGKVALIIDDDVRVRDAPTGKGKYAGVLYKNMVVDVLAESKNRQVINGESHYWYKVKTEEFEGWTYGKFVSFFVRDKNIDSYINRSVLEGYGMDWFYTRFGYSTMYDTSALTAESFTLDQYRNLISAVESGNPMSEIALLASIYPHLKKYPSDPKYAYLKKKLYSDKFLMKLLHVNSSQKIPTDLLNRE